jgi:hypothetical protein
MFNREQNHLLQLLLRLFKSTDVLPFHVWNFNMGFSQGRGIDTSHRKLEMLLGHGHCLEDVCIDFLCFDVDDVHFLSDALESRFSAKSCNIGANKTMGILGNCLQIDVF